MAPYQIFFPIGILGSLVAAGVWLMQSELHVPAMLVHSKLVAGGFLWSFIVGFLMTAIPRMTGTSFARSAEKTIAGILIALLFLNSFKVDARWFYGTQLLLTVFIIIFAAQRVVKATKKIPVFFSHVALAFILAVTGSSYHYFGNSFMGIHLFHLGSILLLILGIGTRFFSFLSGLPSEFENEEGSSWRWLFHALGTSTALLLFLGGQGWSGAYFGLAFVSLIYLFFVWKVQRPSPRPSALKYGVRFAATTIPLSFTLAGLRPEYYIAWFHLLFIGCFVIFTYSVATRVTLAHGAYSTDFETKSRTLWALIALLILSSLARVVYGLVDQEPLRSHLLYVAVIGWLLAIGGWSLTFLKRIFKSGELDKPSC